MLVKDVSHTSCQQYQDKGNNRWKHFNRRRGLEAKQQQINAHQEPCFKWPERPIQLQSNLKLTTIDHLRADSWSFCPITINGSSRFLPAKIEMVIRQKQTKEQQQVGLNAFYDGTQMKATFNWLCRASETHQRLKKQSLLIGCNGSRGEKVHLN